jgi:hypothetical protein
MPVRRRIHHRLGGDIGGGARPVLDDEGLAETLGQPLSDQPRHYVGSAAGRIGGDQVHRPRWIRLRRRNSRKAGRGTAPAARRRNCRRGSFISPLPNDRNPRSIRLDAGELDNLAPLFGFLGDELANVGGRTRKYRAAEVSKPRPHHGAGKRRVDLLVSLLIISLGVFRGTPMPVQEVIS